jgi:hypothetical protein
MNRRDPVTGKWTTTEDRVEALMIRYLEQELRQPRQVRKSEGPAREDAKPT